MFNPSLVLVLRSTLANLTLNRICASGGGTSTYSRFTVFPRVEAIKTARSALVTSLTVPRKKTVSFSMLKLTLCPGSSRSISRLMFSTRRSARSLLVTTLISKKRLVPPSCQMIRLVTPGVLAFSSNWCGLIAVPSTMSPKPTEMRSKGSVLSMTMDFPTVSRRLAGESWSDCAGGSSATGGWPSVCWPAAAFTNDRATRQAARLIATPYHGTVLMASLQAG
jgi:hypothetical protein